MAERVQCLYRVSTTKQVDHDADNHADSPMQRKACREFAAKMGWTIVSEEQETGVSFAVRVPETGLYALEIGYTLTDGGSAACEYRLEVDGAAPCREAVSLTLPRLWKRQRRRCV